MLRIVRKADVDRLRADIDQLRADLVHAEHVREFNRREALAWRADARALIVERDALRAEVEALRERLGDVSDRDEYLGSALDSARDAAKYLMRALYPSTAEARGT